MSFIKWESPENGKESERANDAILIMLGVFLLFTLIGLGLAYVLRG